MKVNKVFILLVIVLCLSLAVKGVLGGVYINEFMANGVNDPQDEWVELYYDGSGSVDLDDWYLENDEWTGNGFVGILNTSHRFITFNYSDLGFALKNTPDTLTLFNSLNQSQENISYSSQAENRSYGRSPDGSNNWVVFRAKDKTPGEINWVNTAPLLLNPTQSISENQTLNLSLINLSSDATDPVSDLTFTLVNSTESSIQLINKFLRFTPSFNFVTHPNLTKKAYVTINVSDGSLSDQKTFEITVSDSNRKPFINAIGNIIFVEGVKSTSPVTASDADGDNLTYSLKTGTFPVGMETNSSSGLINWEVPTKGDHKNITLVVNDGTDSSEKTFDLTVIPALQLLKSGLKTKGIVYNESQGVNVTPGETINVEFSFKNNFNQKLENIVITGHANTASDFINYSDSQWVLTPNSVKTRSFNFNVPYSIADNFILNLKVIDGNSHEDTLSVSFNVIKKEKDIRIDSVFLEDSNLTCTKITDLGLNLTNTGKTNLAANQLKILVYNQQPVNFNEDTGKFATKELLEYIHDSPIGAGVSEQIEGLSLDVRNLSNSNYKFYIYIVSPGFDSTSPYIRGGTTIDFKVGSCLNLAALEGKLKTNKSQSLNSINLLEKNTQGTYIYINEEENQNYDFRFTAGESNNKGSISSCQVDNNDPLRKLSCTSGNKFGSGYGVVTLPLNIKETSTDSEIEENISITINPTLEISNVLINNIPISEGGESSTFNPLTPVTVQFTLTNFMSFPITGITAVFNPGSLFANAQGIKKETLDHLAPGASANFLFVKANHGIPEGKYPLSITVQGIDYQNTNLNREDSFDFNLNIAQQPAEVTISSLRLQDDYTDEQQERNQTYCNQYLTLVVDYANTGTNTESDIIISVSDPTGKINWTSPKMTLAPFSFNPLHPEGLKIPINTFDLLEGEHTLTTKLTYRSGSKTDTKTIKLKKNDCFNAPIINIQENTLNLEIALIDLTARNYTLSKAAGINEKITYQIIDQNNSNLIRCTLTTEGILNCQNLARNAFGTSTLNLTLTAAGKVNGEEKITVNKETLLINVLHVNQPPVILLDDFSFVEDQTYSVSLDEAVHDTDNALNSLTYSIDAKNISVQKTNAGLSFTALKDWYGTETFNFTVRDGINTTSKLITTTVIWNQSDDKASINTHSPTGNNFAVRANDKTDLNITIYDPDQASPQIKWYVDSSNQNNNDPKFIFDAQQFSIDTHTIKAVIYEGTSDEKSFQWTVLVSDRPLDINTFNGPATTNLNQVTDIHNIANFTLENAFGKIVFESADLSNMLYLADLVKIQDKLVAVDSAQALGLKNKKTTVTLYNTGLTKPLIKKTSQFTTDRTLVNEITNINALTTNGLITFEVPGFSTYLVVEDAPADLSVPSEITFDLASIGASVQKSFTITNTGARESLSSIQLSSTADSKYNLTFYEGLSQLVNPFSLAAGASKTIKVNAALPSTVNGGTEKIGDIKFTYGNITKTTPLNIQTKSLLEITSIELNSKSAGKFGLSQENKFSVEVENKGTTEIEDITIEVILKNIDDSSDLDEESDAFDLEANENNEETLTFYLDSDLEKEAYDANIKIKVNGKTVIEQTKRFDVDRKTHQIVIKDTSLPSFINCNDFPSLNVNIENQGKSKEEKVTIKVQSDELGLALEKTGITLDKYSDDDNSYQTSFPLDLSKARKGEHSLTIKVYRSSKEDDSKTLSFTLGDCFATAQTQTSTPALSTQDIAAQLQQQLATAKTTPTSTVNASFRDSNTYLIMLSGLVFLIFVLVILGLVLLLRKN